MTQPTAPPTFKEPDRLTLVPEYLMKQAVMNITGLVDFNTEKGDEVVRRVLAALRLAPWDMPEAPAYHYPNGDLTDDPMFAMSGYRCGWGTFRRNGDVAMCALDEPYADNDEPGPGHTTPGQHGFRKVGVEDHIPFHENDPRTFHAPTWMGDSPEDQQDAADLLNSAHP